MLVHIQNIRQAKGQRTRQCSQKEIANELQALLFFHSQKKSLQLD